MSCRSEIDTAQTTAVAATIVKRTVTVGFADLVALGGVFTGSINIGAALPANARVMGHELVAWTAFSGGAVASATCEIGVAAGDTDAVVTATDVFTGSVAVPGPGVDGILGYPMAPIGAVQLAALFTTTVGFLNALTAGSVTIDVFYIVLP